MATNDWCTVLGIECPDLTAVKDHGDANTHARMIVALLERGEPMTLAAVAARFDEVGIAGYDRALRSLKRCRPARAPVYRDGDHYTLDPYDDELDLWVFRLGLRPAKVAMIRVVRPEPAPLPGEDTPLSVAELDESWKDAGLTAWSAQRLALAVLDAHCHGAKDQTTGHTRGQTMSPPDVVAFVTARTRWHRLREDSVSFKRKACPVAIADNDEWCIAADAGDTLRAVRKTVRTRIEMLRRHAAGQPDPSVLTARRKAWERRRAENARKLEAMSRALLVGFPTEAPKAVALLDVGERRLCTFAEEEFDQLRDRIAQYGIVGAEEVRSLLRALDVDAAGMRLAELGPPQKTKVINGRGRTLKLTTALLVRGTCGIDQPFGDPKRMSDHLAKGDWTTLRRRLEDDAKSLYALYEYGRLHGGVRLRWGLVDEFIPAPWAHRHDQKLHELKRQALERGEALDVVLGNAPDWSAPWSRAQRVRVEKEHSGWRSWLVDAHGHPIDEDDVQRARLSSARR